MAEKNKLWTREELIVSFNLYLKLPFGKLHSGTPEIIHLAKIIGRTPSSVAMRLSNFASVDPYHQQRGAGGFAACGGNTIPAPERSGWQEKSAARF